MPIYYSGMGTYKEDDIYTEIEFLQIMINWFVERDWNDPSPIIQSFLRVLKEYNPEKKIPEDFPLFSLDDWIEFAGAKRINN